jgi:DNA-binding transcriptional LysR family regulator
VYAEAPKSTLIAEYVGTETEAREEPGEIQVRVSADPCGPDHCQRRLWQSSIVVAMRSGHPAAADRISLDRFLSLPQLRVAGASIGARVVDNALAKRGMSCRIAVTVPSLSAVLPILQHTDLAAVQPAQWIRLHGEPGRIITAPLPLPAITCTMDMIWQKGDDSDAGHRWLRGVIEQEFGILNSLYESDKFAGDTPDFLDRVPGRPWP